MLLKLLFPLLALIAGMAVVVQGQINGGLGRKIGVIEGAFFSFALGTLVLLLILIFLGNGQISAINTVPKWQLLGGILGVFFVIVQVLVVPKIGVSTTLLAVIVGQIILSVTIDHFGLFGAERRPIDMNKMAAVSLMFIALYLYNKK
ncbi:DMT family transporter [Lysinibacillus antri]|uniref:DMT family transporter n=1 Tax=Lysinibacillus antri TaxID=2498145 RepID=A0A432L6P5_9BACI|nr:DMT family transporter [Lysinibacillus antri]RUL45659.1 DMT family transporter [Lysinibacillus antri]